MVLGAYVVIYACVTYSGLLEGLALLWWSDVAWTLISFAAAAKCLHTASLQQQRNRRRAWLAFGSAALSWFIGMLIWDYLELVRAVVTPYPSPADYFYLALAPLFVLGIFFYREDTPTRYVTLTQIGNMGIIVCTVIIVTSIILYPQIESASQPKLYVYFAIAYAAAYMSAFLFGLYSYWFYRWSSNRQVFLLLLLALFLHTGVDTLYTFELMGKSYGAANYLNVFWILAFAIQYWAAAEQDILDRQAPAVESEGAPTLQKLESIVPALSLLAIVSTLWLFGEHVSYRFLTFLLGVSLILVGFMVLREWSLKRTLVDAQTNLEEQVRQRTLQLTLANSELEAYSYSIAHDLRSPLRAVTGFSQVLLEDAALKLNDDEKDSLNRIAAAGKDMARMIDEILELARLSRTELDLAPVDLSGISRSMAQQLSEHQPERAVEWSVQDGLMVQGDTRLLSLAMQNLLDNAFKYSAKQPHPRIEVGAMQIRGDTVYYVRDNGSGFDTRYADRLFKPFHRLHRQDEFPGSGVGLATVLRIIERHAGRIWAEAEPERGATFYFTFGLKA